MQVLTRRINELELSSTQKEKQKMELEQQLKTCKDKLDHFYRDQQEVIAEIENEAYKQATKLQKEIRELRDAMKEE